MITWQLPDGEAIPGGSMVLPERGEATKSSVRVALPLS